MPGSPRTSLLVCAFAAALAGCGSSQGGPIPAQSSDRLVSHLDAVESAVRNGDCEAAAEQAQAFGTEVEQLPAQVDGELETALARSAERLSQLADEQCGSVSGATGVEGAEPPPKEPVEPPPTAPEEQTTEQETGDGGPPDDRGGGRPEQDAQPPQTGTGPPPGSGQGQGPPEGTPPSQIEPGEDGGVLPGETGGIGPNEGEGGP